MNWYVNKQNCRIPVKVTVGYVVWMRGNLYICPVITVSDEHYWPINLKNVWCHTAYGTFNILQEQFKDIIISQEVKTNRPPRACDLSS